MFRASMLMGVCILGLALLVGTSASQDKKDKAKGQLPQGWKDLNLTASQKEKVYEINSEYKTKIDELNKKINELKGQQKKAQIAVLTEDQRQQLAKLVIGEDAKKKDEKKKDEKKSGEK